MINPEIIKLIKESTNIVILSHISPDGDSIGSSLALFNALAKYDKKATFILDDEIPYVYKFLKGANKVEKPNYNDNFDLVVVLDSGDIGRLGKSAKYLDGKKVINIDHHISNTSFGTNNMIDSNAAATAEIVYHIIKTLGIDMDEDIAECLYTGIVTDTGQFQYSNTTSITHQIAGDLINCGVEPSKLYKLIYQNNTREKINLIIEALKSLEFYLDGRISCITLKKEQFNKIGAKEEDADGIINFARDIDSVEVALFFRENDDGKIKVGFRSKDYIDVNTIAEKFDGGGHKRASGATISGNIDEIKENVLKKVVESFMAVEK